MTTAVPTVSKRVGSNDGSLMLVTWAMVTGDTVGSPVPFAEWADRSVQWVGATWNGATVLLEGSLDGTNYAVLTDPQGNALTKTADALEAVTECCQFVRPRVSVGALTAVNVILLLRRGQPLRT